MSQIGKSDGGPFGGWSGHLAGGGPGGGNALGQRGGLESRSGRFDQTSNGRAGMDRRATALAAEIRAAAQSLVDEETDDQGDLLPAADAQLLARAEPSDRGLPPQIGGAAAEVAGPSRTESTVKAMTDLIERTIRAEIAALSSQPTVIRVNLAQSIPGVAGITLTLGPSMLDVVIERSTSSVSDELANAAAMLAQRLSSRFSGRMVRIFQSSTSRHSRPDPASRESET